MPVVDRFWRQVKKDEGCWLWSAATDQDGYGVFRGIIGGEMYTKAHRFSYALHTGEILPDGIVVMHSCDNPRCVNPDHLSVGSHRDNMLDKIAKDRANIPKATLAPVSILTFEQVSAIVFDARPYTQIAADYGVSSATIGVIKKQYRGKIFVVEDDVAHAMYGLCNIKDCDLAAVALGLCKEHWRRNREYGSPAVIKHHLGQFSILPAEERFWQQIHKTKSCWLWTAFTDKNGYGRFRGKLGKKIYATAHRFSYALHTGEIVADGMAVMHSCDNPGCVNPDHLSVGTCHDNMVDKAVKGRSNIAKGEAAPGARLTEQQVHAIVLDSRTYVEIGADYCVAASTIGSIKQGVSWKSLNVEKIVHSKRTGMRGETQWAAKLTESDVREIRLSILSGKSLAEKFGVTPQAICNIRKRRIWKHIE